MGKLIIEGNQVYEIDEECMQRKREEEARNTTNKRNPKESKGNQGGRGNRRNRT